MSGAGPLGRGESLLAVAGVLSAEVFCMSSGARQGPLNLPNTLSLIRIATAPLLVLLLLYPSRSLSVAATVVFVLVSITDWLDGYIARKWEKVTPLGKFLDPLADKLLIVTAFIMLIELGRVPAWGVAAIVAREMAVTGLRAIASNAGVVIAAGRLGKAKTVSQIACLIPLLLHYPFYGVDFHAVGIVVFYIAVALTLWSGFDYFRDFISTHGFSADPD